MPNSCTCLELVLEFGTCCANFGKHASHIYKNLSLYAKKKLVLITSIFVRYELLEFNFEFGAGVVPQCRSRVN